MIQIFVLISFLAVVHSCSNILATRGATSDGSNIVAYNADSANLYGSLYHYPKGIHAAGTMHQIFDWDTGVYLGEIPEAAETYNVVGNANEWGVVIGETTYGGLANLQEQDGAIMDYGSLIWVTLQRAKTARQAIQVLDALMQKYGYASEGESFSIMDQNEVWIMEIIGKGNFELGSVWVARKIPDGYVSAHANQARITTFPYNDPSTTLYANDVVSFARKIGVYDGSDADFSFSDVYDEVTFEGARFCEARVWSFFSSILGSDFEGQYYDYAAGYNLTNRMPLWVQPNAKISVTDTMQYMRNHYEGTKLDMTGTVYPDAGAIFSSMPARARPLTWTNSNGVEYLNERAIGTPQTGWNFVAQSRAQFPAPLAAVLFFGVDDSSTTVRFPIHGGAKAVPEAFGGPSTQDGFVQPLLSFNWKSAFTVFNVVANFAYPRWSLVYPDILQKINQIESNLIQSLDMIDMQAMTIYQDEGEEAAVNAVTQWAVQNGNNLVDTWGQFFGQLFMKYRDGYVITSEPGEPSCACNIADAPYPQAWYDRIAADSDANGDRLRVPTENDDDAGDHSRLASKSKRKTVNKLKVRGVM